MKLSIFYDHVLDASRQSGLPVTELLLEAKAAGICAVEINHDNLSRQPEMLPAIQNAGMKISGSFLFYDFGEKEYGDERRMREQIDTAQKLGYSGVLFVPGFLSEEDAGVLNQQISFVFYCSRSI